MQGWEKELKQTVLRGWDPKKLGIPGYAPKGASLKSLKKEE